VTWQCENLTPQEVRRRRIPNTTVLTLEGRPGAWRFVAWDEPRLLDLAADGIADLTTKQRDALAADARERLQ